MMTSINTKRLQQTIDELRIIGEDEHGVGTSRLAGSPAELAAREWLLALCTSRGISAVEDAAGNIICRIGPPGAPVVTGSHLDSVPQGGHLDGALGVLCGLEALTVIHESKLALKRPLELIAFFDEEGRFGSMIGSKALAGRLDINAIKTATDETGRSLQSLLETRGSSASKVLGVQRKRGDVYAFLELHIEQGPVLDSEGCTIGAVEHITGIVRWRAQFEGEANHAGTTPMHLRRDAFRGLVEFSNTLQETCAELGSSQTRYTIGRVELTPNYVGVVPRVAQFTLDLRETSAVRLAALNEALLQSAQEIARASGLTFDVEVHGRHEPTPCHPALVGLVGDIAQQHNLKHMNLLSGALHDAASMSNLGPVGMIFVPSVGGVSHSEKEDTKLEDIFSGAAVLLGCLSTLLTEDLIS